jgi:hypothetical protein
MKLQVTIGNDFTMNTTPQGLGNCFTQEDATILKDMLNLSAVLHLEGESINQYIDGVRYAITVIK